MNCMQDNMKEYWGKLSQKINVSTCTIVNPCLDVMTVTEVKQIPKGVFNINKARKNIQRRTICITYSDHDYILD